MKELLKNVLQVKYVKLHFAVAMVEDCELPEHKASAIRGGIGEMLIRSCCVRNRDCDNCDFADECIVQRTMYSHFKIKPPFITQRESAGYVLDCADRKRRFHRGNQLKFQLTLFGNTIVYFSQYLQAISLLGMNGLGKNNAQFQIADITNTRGESLLQDGEILMDRYQVERLRDYVDYRKKKLMGAPQMITFVSPATVKHNGAYIQSFDAEAIIRAVQRRLYILSCFEGMDEEEFYRYTFEIPEVLSESSERVQVRRYSNRQEAAVTLKGITGHLEIEPVESEELIELLLAGELVHIGKNTSFGFGKYRLM